MSAINKHLGTIERPKLLDLGLLRAKSLAFFSSFSGNYRIADFRDELASGEFDTLLRGQFNAQQWADVPPKAEIEQAALIAFREFMLTSGTDVKYDLICFWDLLNFLTPAERRGALGAVHLHLAPNALLFFMSPERGAHYSQPALFETDGQELAMFPGPQDCAAGANPVRTGFALSVNELSDALHYCSLESSVRLKNGVFELLYRVN